MTSSNFENHTDLVESIIQSCFGEKSEKIVRMITGLDNEVYLISVAGTEYIVRMNERDSLKGSSIYIPLFASKGIKVPEIIREDYSKTVVPYNWQMMSKIEGQEIGTVISTLSHQQLDALAKEIANIINILLTLPTNTLFGSMGISEKKLKSSLLEVTQEMLSTIKKRNEETKVVKIEHIHAFEKALSKYSSYFKNAKSQFFFDDMSSKNVMIHQGKFNGLVDLDYVAYGDFLELIGSIKISWFGTEYGDYYTKSVMSALKLTEEQKEIVTLWALLNKIYWQSEIGIQFNKNTSAHIDHERVENGNTMIDLLVQELRL